MKKLFLTILAMMTMTMVTGSAMALSFSDVGAIDKLIAEAKLDNSGDAVEIAWVDSVLGGSHVFTGKYDVDGDDWEKISSGVYAHVLRSEPVYFLVKTGAGRDTTNDDNTHFLFENLGALNWGVINLGQMGMDVMNIAGLSHIGEFDGTPVPEPATILLFGSGLVGLAGFGRKKFKK